MTQQRTPLQTQHRPNDVASLGPAADIVLVGVVGMWGGEEGGRGAKSPATHQPGAAASQK